MKLRHVLSLVLFVVLGFMTACGSEGAGAPETGSMDSVAMRSRGAFQESGLAPSEESEFEASRTSSSFPETSLEDDVFARLAPGEELWVIDRAGISSPAADEGPRCGCLFGRRHAAETVAMPLEKTRVRADVAGHIATVDVTQVFANPFDTKIEAIYVFPLPHDAAVSEFVMTVGDRRIRGIVRKKEEAERIYKRARARGLVAALLSQQRPNVFTQNVANIEPGRRLEISMRYFNRLPWRDGGFEFDFPTVVGPRFNPPGWEDAVAALPRGSRSTRAGAVTNLAENEESAHRIDLEVRIDSAVPIRSLRSSSHAVEVRKDGDRRAQVVLAQNDRVPDRDFQLRWELAGDRPEAGLVLHDGPEGRFFSFMLVPPRELDSIRREPVEFVFVVDCSGSMRGAPLDKAKTAMRRALRACRPEDRFQIIRFSSGASQLGDDSLPATPENIRRGLRYLDELSGGGGTVMIEGIKAALETGRERGMRRVVSFMTDGYIGNEVEIFEAIHRRLNEDTRIFSFGIGNSVNRHLIEGMARIGRGAVAYVSLQDDSGAKVDAFYEKVRRPALANPQLDWAGARVRDVYPSRLPDLHHGRPVMVVGRVEGELPSQVVVRGQVGGASTRMVVPVRQAWQQHPGIARVWARTRIADLEYEAAIRRRDTTAAVEAIALEFGIVSSQTSFLAVDTSRRTRGHEGVQVPVAVPVPDGVRYDTTVPPSEHR